MGKSRTLKRPDSYADSQLNLTSTAMVERTDQQTQLF